MREIELLRQIRRQVKSIQKEPPPTRELLAQLNKWGTTESVRCHASSCIAGMHGLTLVCGWRVANYAVEWPQVIKVLAGLKQAYEDVQEDTDVWAEAMQKWLIVAFYTYFPPVRIDLHPYSFAISLKPCWSSMRSSSYVGASKSHPHTGNWQIVVP